MSPGSVSGRGEWTWTLPPFRPCVSLARPHICHFANAVFTSGSIQKLALQLPPTLEAGSSKNRILRMGWGLKEMSEERLALKSTGLAGPAGWTSRLIQDAFATQTMTGLTVELSPTPRAQRWAVSKDLSPVLLVKTWGLSLYYSTVFKLLAFCPQGHQRAYWKSRWTPLFLPHVQIPNGLGRKKLSVHASVFVSVSSSFSAIVLTAQVLLRPDKNSLRGRISLFV